MAQIFYKSFNSIANRELKMVITPKLTDEQKKTLERMHNRVDYIFEIYREYFDALAEFDRTGVLKIHGKVLYVRKYESEKENEDKYLNLQ
ncbi:MAG: hypothetical protein L7G92_00425 [Stygiolobus sp.]|nr:hypothetical protein [Stygiolobus sp.]